MLGKISADTITQTPTSLILEGETVKMEGSLLITGDLEVKATHIEIAPGSVVSVSGTIAFAAETTIMNGTVISTT